MGAKIEEPESRISIEPRNEKGDIGSKTTWRICEDDPYLLELTRYIHLNPLRAGVVKSLEELNGYRWAGHSVIMGQVKREWKDTDVVLGYFGKKRKTAIEKYEAFVKEGIPQGRRPELVGGGPDKTKDVRFALIG